MFGKLRGNEPLLSEKDIVKCFNNAVSDKYELGGKVGAVTLRCTFFLPLWVQDSFSDRRRP